MLRHRDIDTSVQRLTATAMLGAASALLMLLDFPIPFVPPFVKLDFSEVPVILAGLLLGPTGGVITAVLKILLHLLLRGTVTIGVGELANFTGSISYMLPAAYLYRNSRFAGGLFLPLLCATATVSLIVVIMNYYVFFPAYAGLMGLTTDAFVALGRETNASINNLKALMLYCLLPFNIFKYGLTSLITVPLLKQLGKFRQKQKG